MRFSDAGPSRCGNPLDLRRTRYASRMSEQNLAHRIRHLEDLAAIQALKYSYAMAVDRGVADPSQASVAAIVELFTDDTLANYGQFGTYHGREALTGFFRDMLPSIASWTRHYMHDPVLELDGDTATGRWYAVAQVVMKANPGAGPQPMYVTYEDRYRRTDAGWKLAEMIVHFDQPGAAT